MARPRLLLVPSFTELEWGIRPALEEWADVASFDVPGVGGEPLPFDLDDELTVAQVAELLPQWRAAGVARALAEVDRQDWDDFFVVTDANGAPTAVGVATARRESVLGFAFGHAALSTSSEGERPPMSPQIWEVLRQLVNQGSDAFVRYGIAQATRGGVDEETAQEMLERFPDTRVISAVLEGLGSDPEPIGDDLAALDLPMLFGKHEGCLSRTDEGFEDIVGAFPNATTVICDMACSSSPEFAEALRAFCEELGRASV